MATYGNLPVYKISYDLLIQTFEIVTKFNKQYKYTLGDKIKTSKSLGNFWETIKNKY